MTDRRHEQRFEALLRDHRRIIFKVAAVYAPDADERQDLVQEISVQLWRSFGSYDERRASLSTWIYRIALNVAISQLRRRNGALARRLDPLEAHHLETIGGAEGVESEDERLTELYAFIGELDALNRALILLYLEERSHAEIAEILGITPTNVATKISRIKRTLRDRMVAADITGA